VTAGFANEVDEVNPVLPGDSCWAGLTSGISQPYLTQR
jgi:hypothetical protein